jgi:hypothetical protein
MTTFIYRVFYSALIAAAILGIAHEMATLLP